MIKRLTFHMEFLEKSLKREFILQKKCGWFIKIKFKFWYVFLIFIFYNFY